MPSDPQSSLVQGLVSAFKDLLPTHPIPKWAHPYNPPVPFVGSKYEPTSGMLVYGSAENLARVVEGNPQIGAFHRDPDKALLRRWHWYEYRSRNAGGGDGKFFGPGIGIEPFDNGGLITVAYFIARRLGLATREDPPAFLETLAVGNWCKFSINGHKNQDYAGDPGKLEASRPYVCAELLHLRPAVVIVPAKIESAMGMHMAQACDGTTRIVPLRQFAYWPINKDLKPYQSRALEMRKEAERADPTLATWMGEIRVRGAKKGNHWRYLAHAESVVNA